MSEITTAVVTVLTAIVGVAILAVIVSRNSNTAGVLNAGGNAFANMLRAATGPVSGGMGGGVSMPSFGGMGGF